MLYLIIPHETDVIVPLYDFIRSNAMCQRVHCKSLARSWRCFNSDLVQYRAYYIMMILFSLHGIREKLNAIQTRSWRKHYPWYCFKVRFSFIYYKWMTDNVEEYNKYIFSLAHTINWYISCYKSFLTFTVKGTCIGMWYFSCPTFLYVPVVSRSFNNLSHGCYHNLHFCSSWDPY